MVAEFPSLHLAEVPADGNCLFSSIAVLLRCVFSGTAHTHVSVREAIFNYMHDNLDVIPFDMDERGRSDMSTISECILLEMHDCPRPPNWKVEWPPLNAHEVRNTTA